MSFDLCGGIHHPSFTIMIHHHTDRLYNPLNSCTKLSKHLADTSTAPNSVRHSAYSSLCLNLVYLFIFFNLPTFSSQSSWYSAFVPSPCLRTFYNAPPLHSCSMASTSSSSSRRYNNNINDKNERILIAALHRVHVGNRPKANNTRDLIISVNHSLLHLLISWVGLHT